MISIELKYPIFTYGKKEKMIYVFYRRKDSHTTNAKIIKKAGYPGSTIIDSTGMKYVIKRAQKAKWRGFYGYFTGMQGRVFEVEFEYEDESVHITLDELKAIILDRYPKSYWFRSAWSSKKEFDEEMSKCMTFEEVARVVGEPPQSIFFLRIIRGYF